MNDHLIDHDFLSAKDRRTDLEQEWYERLSHEIETEMRAEHVAEFGDSPRYPFMPSTGRIHDAVVARMAKIKAENE